jgi:uncharacterized protein YecT (DUF1311 family)
MRTVVMAVAVVVATGVGCEGARAASGCGDLSYAEQEACWTKLLAVQSRRLRRAVDARIAAVTPEDLNDASRYADYGRAVRKAQAMWEAYRDAECAEPDFLQRRHIQEAIAACKADLNEARLKFMEGGSGH